MEYKGKRICGIKITDGNEVVATICEDKIETTNGYKVEIIPHLESVETD